MTKQSKATGLPPANSLPRSPSHCSTCCLGKQSRKNVPSQALTGQSSAPSTMPSSRTSTPLELLHSDLCGPMPTKSISGSRYFLTITDDFSRFIWVYFLKTKGKTLSKFKAFKTIIELQTSFRIKAIRSDRGGEYTSQAFQQFCEETGIVRQFSQARTPHQNGVAERKNRSLLDKAHCMTFERHSYPSLDRSHLNNKLLNQQTLYPGACRRHSLCKVFWNSTLSFSHSYFWL